jgi:2-C-methyl-D-erythritol 4-phosphate cytidylyltransferase
MAADVALVIAAAGESARMKSAVRKPFLDLGGRPIIAVTLEKFAPVSRICQVIVTLNRADFAQKDSLLKGPLPLSITDVVAGGATRTGSVANALAVLSPAVRIVLIHDAVRPFVSASVIESVIAAAERFGAAIAAAPVRDTIKRVESGLVTGTIPREGLYLAQTPQGFRREIIEKAYRARGDKDFTDDALLVEVSGGKVAIVDGGCANFKITTPEDLAVARAIIAAGLGA